MGNLLCRTGKPAVAGIQSFLEPVCRKGGIWGCPAQLWGKESDGTQQRWGKHEKRQRRAHSGRDEGGLLANRVRRLLFSTKRSRVETWSCLLCEHCFFKENKSFGAPPFALILCQYASWFHIWNINVLLCLSFNSITSSKTLWRISQRQFSYVVKFTQKFLRILQ